MRLGILGSGQLAAMLTMTAQKLGHSVAIYADCSDGPATNYASFVYEGSLSDRARLRDFFTQIDIVIFENEFIDLAAINEARAFLPTQFFPDAAMVFALSDKIRQKEILARLTIKTPSWMLVPSSPSQENLRRIIKHFAGRCVFKWSRFGYDGKGVLPWQDRSHTISTVQDFCEQGHKRGAKILVEEHIDFVQELAMVAVR